MNRHGLLALKVCGPVVALYLATIWLHGDVWIPSGTQGSRPRADLMTFYAAARLAIDSPDDMYSVSRQGEVQALVTGEPIAGDDPDFLPFAYPAATALLMAPLTLVGYLTAYWIVVVLNVIGVGGLVYLLSSRLQLSFDAAQTFALSCTVCAGLYATLVQGQLSIFVALALSMSVLDLREDREVRAGVWSGLLSLKPVVLPGILVWLALRRRWRTLGATLLVSGAFAVVSLAWIWPDGFAQYRLLSTGMLTDGFGTAQAGQMLNLRGLTSHLIPGNGIWIATLALMVLVLYRARVGGDWDLLVLLLAVPLMTLHMRLQETALLLPAVAFASRLVPMTARNQRLIVLAMLISGWASVIFAVPAVPVAILIPFLWVCLSGRYRPKEA